MSKTKPLRATFLVGTPRAPDEIWTDDLTSQSARVLIFTSFGAGVAYFELRAPIDSPVSKSLCAILLCFIWTPVADPRDNSEMTRVVMGIWSSYAAQFLEFQDVRRKVVSAQTEETNKAHYDGSATRHCQQNRSVAKDACGCHSGHSRWVATAVAVSLSRLLPCV